MTKSGAEEAAETGKLEEAGSASLRAFAAAAASPPPRTTLGVRLRNYFLTGLIIVGPVTITR